MLLANMTILQYVYCIQSTDVLHIQYFLCGIIWTSFELTLISIPNLLNTALYILVKFYTITCEYLIL